jgi:nanoRNase/pAp phosphatase (c-di-AMP/oligoRNAs hydrolase)
MADSYPVRSMASEAATSLTGPAEGQRGEVPGRTTGRKRRGTGRFTARRKAPTLSRPDQVTVIGHNAKVLETVGFFVAMELPVRVYTTSAQLEVQLAPYPGVNTTLITDDYAQAPRDLPPPPYVVNVDHAGMAERIRDWLPPTWARFQVRGATRGKGVPGLLRLSGLDHEDRPVMLRRLASLTQLDRLCAVARDAQRPLILLYGDPDPDAIGAALGLATLWRKAGVDSEIRYTGEVQRYQNKLLLSYLKKGIERLDPDEQAASDCIAVVDAQPGFWRENPPAARVVIDHHPVKEGTRDCEFVDLRPDYGSTSSMITEYLLDAEVVLDRKLATALIYGISTDTDDLKRHTHAADIAAFEALHQRADRTFLSRLEKSQIPPAVLDYIAWGISHRVVYRDLVVIHFGTVPTADVLVQVADLLLLTNGVTWVACAGVVEKGGRRLVVVFRGDGFQQDVGRRAAQAFAKLGSAGGHRTMGRAEIPLDDDQTVGATVSVLVDNLFARMSPARRRRFAKTLAGHLADERPADPDEFELST